MLGWLGLLIFIHHPAHPAYASHPDISTPMQSDISSTHDPADFEPYEDYQPTATQPTTTIISLPWPNSNQVWLMSLLFMTHFNLGWAQFYDVQTPPRRPRRFPYNTAARIGGMEVTPAQTNIKRIGQLLSSGFTIRLLSQRAHPLSLDATGQFTLVTPHGPWLNNISNHSTASSLHTFSLSTTIAQQRTIHPPTELLRRIHLKYGWRGRVETTSFANLITGHRRRALLMGGVLSLGALSQARIQLSALTKIVDSFRFYTSESLKSYQLTTSSSTYHDLELNVAKHLFANFIGELSLIWRPSDVTVADITEYNRHGFLVHTHTTDYSPTAILTTTQFTLTLTKVF